MPLRVAVVYNTKDRAPDVMTMVSGKGVITPTETASPTTTTTTTTTTGTPDDVKAELDTMETVGKYVEFIKALGHEVILIHGDIELAHEMKRLEKEEGKKIDICWNTCEGYRGMDREAQIPAILEMIGMPYSFARPLGMALTLDKAMTKRILAFHNIPTPAFQEITQVNEPLNPNLVGKWPLFIKPNAEGTGMGITAKSLCRTESELRERLGMMIGSYGQSVLVEEFIPGRDVTCGIVGNPSIGSGIHVLEINEVDYKHTKVPDDLAAVVKSEDDLFYCRSIKALTGSDFVAHCPAHLPIDVTNEIKRLTVEVFRVCLGRDGARVDFRIDTRGGHLKPIVLEINEIPGMTWESDLTVCAQGQGFTHAQLVQNIFAASCERYGLDHNLGSARWKQNWP